VKRTVLTPRLAGAGLAILALVWPAGARQRPSIVLAPPEAVADGIALHRSADASLLGPGSPGPLAVVAVEVDARRTRLGTVLAHRCSPARETVLDIAAREQALVAINAGFFLPNGAPAGVLKQGGRWIGGSSRARGVAAFPAPRPGEPARVLLARATVSAGLRVRSGLRTHAVPLDHLTPQQPGDGLNFYAAPCPPAVADGASSSGACPGAGPASAAGPPAPVAPVGAQGPVTWHLDANGRVVPGGSHADTGAAATARSRLEFRGREVPRELQRLRTGARVTVVPRIASVAAATLARAPDAVAGAGLLIAGGQPVTDWTMERLSPTFATDRHPRSVIGVDAEGDIWLIAVDGRQPAHGVGMSFVELQRLGLALGLREALNLDGGGSTTLVVRGRIVNRPSDVTGPRPVSDAIVVRAR
jgi:hypothetical protein